MPTEPKPWDRLLGAAYECNHTRPWNACFECAIEARNAQIVAELLRRAQALDLTDEHREGQHHALVILADDIADGKV